jgi:hypothetical protein
MNRCCRLHSNALIDLGIFTNLLAPITEAVLLPITRTVEMMEARMSNIPNLVLPSLPIGKLKVA